MYSKSVMARRHSKTFDNTCGGDLGSAILYFCKERNDETQHYPQAGKFVLVPMQDLKPYQHMCSGHLWKNKAYITKYYKLPELQARPEVLENYRPAVLFCRNLAKAYKPSLRELVAWLNTELDRVAAGGLEDRDDFAMAWCAQDPYRIFPICVESVTKMRIGSNGVAKMTIPPQPKLEDTVAAFMPWGTDRMLKLPKPRHQD